MRYICKAGHETAVCCRMVLGEKGLAVSLNTKMLLMTEPSEMREVGAAIKKNQPR
jgi:hypothetical protein